LLKSIASDQMSLVRLSKIMASRGLCSRREAEQLIIKGLVKVDGKVVSLENSLFPENVVLQLDDQHKEDQIAKLSVVFNKPVGWVSSQPEHGNVPAIKLLTQDNFYGEWDKTMLIPSQQAKIAVAGRLDEDSRGLLLFTQDGRLARTIIDPQSSMDKEYVVKVSGNITPRALSKLNYGLSIDGE
jgi:23S rRNA pseudouridine2604 synthase